MNAPLDDTHRMSIEATRAIRRECANIRAAIARWEPAQCPPLRIDAHPSPHRTPYLDEIELPDKLRWLR